LWFAIFTDELLRLGTWQSIAVFVCGGAGIGVGATIGARAIGFAQTSLARFASLASTVLRACVAVFSGVTFAITAVIGRLGLAGVVDAFLASGATTVIGTISACFGPCTTAIATCRGLGVFYTCVVFAGFACCTFAVLGTGAAVFGTITGAIATLGRRAAAFAHTDAIGDGFAGA
jgi:hypothetical protein